MGPYQELQLTFNKAAKNEAEAREFQSEVVRRVGKVPKSETQSLEFIDGKASVFLTLFGEDIYDTDKTDDVLLGKGRLSAKKVTRQLGCELVITCIYGGQQEDEVRVYEKGELTEKWEKIDINVKCPEVQEFDRIIDNIEKKGLGEEAQRLREIARKMAARYLFSSSSVPS